MRLPSPLARRRARIEIIPLIDIMFFLLATFIMVSLSMIKNLAVPINLPSAHSAKADQDRPAAVLSVDKGGQVFWGKERVPLDEVPGRLAALKAADPDPKVYIHGDREAGFGAVVSVLDLVRKAGIKRTSIRTKPARD